MTKEERLSGNRLLGEFKSRSFSMSHINDYKNCPDNELPKMKYHSDWGWLIPVWYKFRDLRFDDFMDQFKHSDFKRLISHAICYEGIENAYNEICKAIKWYNSQK